MAINTERYIYRLDASDTITFVNSDYLRFAQENEAPELDSKATIGKSIWTFVTGDEVQALYRTVFHHLRRQKSEFIVPFRCDSPTIIRHMQLTLRSLSFGGVECEGRIVHVENRDSVSLFSRKAARSDEAIPICSLCRRLLVDKHWIDAGSAIIQNRLFSIERTPGLEETVCLACEQAVQTEIPMIDASMFGGNKK